MKIFYDEKNLTNGNSTLYSPVVLLQLEKKEIAQVNEVLEQLVLNTKRTLDEMYVTLKQKSSNEQYVNFLNIFQKFGRGSSQLGRWINDYKKEVDWEDVYKNSEIISNNVKMKARFKTANHTRHNIEVYDQDIKKFTTFMLPHILVYKNIISISCAQEYRIELNKYNYWYDVSMKSLFYNGFRNVSTNFFQRKVIKDFRNKIIDDFCSQTLSDTLSNRQFLFEYVDWNSFSNDPEIINRLDLVYECRNDLNWTKVSGHPLTDEFIERFDSRINWNVVSARGLKISNEAIEKNIRKINWKNVSKSRINKLPVKLRSYVLFL